MAQVTLRDLTTNEDIIVPPEGYIFGRVGGDADIQLEDNSISRRQARVSLKGGMWLLETLAVPQGARAPRPVQLQEGASFAVGESEFEVVQIEAEDEPEADPAARTFAPQKGKPGPAPAAAPGKKAPPPPNAKTTPSTTAQKRAPTLGAPAAEAEEPSAKGIGALFVGVPKGIAYYLLNVPKLLVNPIGTVRKTIEEQPTEPMGKTGIIGYALPSLFVTMALSSIASGLGQLIGPAHHFDLFAFIPIGAAIGAVIGAVVMGFVFHPVTEWIITKLQGTSDARSRSNYFLQLMTVAIIVAVPNALGIILAFVPVPFIGLLGPLLMLVGSLVTLYVNYQWLVHFGVVKWVFMVVKVLGVLTLLAAGANLVTGIIASVKSLGSGGGSSAPVAAIEGGETELGEMPTDPAEAAEWSKKKQAEMTARAAEAQKAALAAAAAGKDKPDEPVKTVKKDGPPEPKKGDPKPEPKADPEPEPEPVAVKDTTPPPPPKDPPVVKDEPVVAAPVANSGYGTFAKRRDAIEKLFESDPTMLKNSELQRLYADYLENAWELDRKWAKESAKKPERARLNARLRDAELYGKTGKTIDTLAGKLGLR